VRQFGDLDLYFFDRHDEADEVARRELHVQVDNHSHHHTRYELRGITIESHYDFVNTPYPPSNRNYETLLKEQAPSPTLADRVAAMGLDDEASQRLVQLTEGIGNDRLSDDLLAILARGISHDDDVQNADATGYLRGRNEKIEAVLHPQSLVEDEAPATPVFPRYCRRSIWE
jgi:hypothetical protein